MKKSKLFLAALMSVVMASTLCVGFTSCDKTENSGSSSSGTTSDSGSTSNSTGGDEVTAHVCRHACYVCGKCLDDTCEDPVCEEKCGEGLTVQKFEAEDSHVILQGGSLGRLGIFKEEQYGATETYIGNFNANIGASITFEINSPADTVASLVVSVCKRQQTTIFTNNVAVLVNGMMVESPSEVPSNGKEYDTWTEFVDVNLGCIELSEGKNTIVFSVMDAEATAGYNFNSMSVKSDEELTWYEEPNVDPPEDDFPPEEELNFYWHEAEETYSNGLANFGGDDRLWRIAEAHGQSGEYYIGQVFDRSNDAPGEYYFRWIVTAEEDCKVRISVNGGVGGIDVDMGTAFSLKVGDEDVTLKENVVSADTGENSWYNWTDYELGTFSLKAGEETEIYLYIESGCAMNIDGFRFAATGNLTFTSVTAD